MDGLILTNIFDHWIWSLEATCEFSVKFVRYLIDDSILPKEEVTTRWVKVMPIKINIFAWRVRLDKLPTRLNISLKVSIHVGEALATGRTNIVPVDVAAAAQSAALDMLRCYEQMTEPGSGMLTPLGRGVDTTLHRLTQRDSGIQDLCVEDLTMNGFDKGIKSYTFD
ncbi:hypothetical protein Tco_0808063 [Tanacetum coccineum]